MVLVLQVGMMLRGMGFDNMTTIYVAAGKIYRAEKYMAPLRQLFPFLETKESIASADELAPFKVRVGFFICKFLITASRLSSFISFFDF